MFAVQATMVSNSLAVVPDFPSQVLRMRALCVMILYNEYLAINTNVNTHAVHQKHHFSTCSLCLMQHQVSASIVITAAINK
jgi:hypothetical protein